MRGLSARVGVGVGDWGVIYGDIINVVGDYTLRSKKPGRGLCTRGGDYQWYFMVFGLSFVIYLNEDNKNNNNSNYSNNRISKIKVGKRHKDERSN